MHDACVLFSYLLFLSCNISSAHCVWRKAYLCLLSRAANTADQSDERSSPSQVDSDIFGRGPSRPRRRSLGEFAVRTCGLIAGGWKTQAPTEGEAEGEGLVPRVGEAGTWRNHAASTSSVRTEHMELSQTSAPQSHWTKPGGLWQHAASTSNIHPTSIQHPSNIHPTSHLTSPYFHLKYN